METQKIMRGEKVVILADHREIASNVTRHLREHDADIREIQLKVGDYIVSERVAVERKSVPDFLQSVIDQRLFKQMEQLADSYEKPVLILEGNPELLFLERNMHANTVRGVLSSIAIDYRIPIIWTHNSKETAAQIYWMAYREQVQERKGLQIRCNKRNRTLAHHQEFLVAGLPNVSNVLSKRLLKHFGTVRDVYDATPEELMKVEGIGKEKAKNVWELINAEYQEKED
ncbi:MAG: helix-hairpin-helix domain-containing protein [Candidatus Aenigmarchaeota archaeon]|nr:helix-hairpin-helix domain-containing protein [Candidatus Aenigmarchaeota archaeon]